MGQLNEASIKLKVWEAMYSHNIKKTSAPVESDCSCASINEEGHEQQPTIIPNMVRPSTIVEPKTSNLLVEAGVEPTQSNPKTSLKAM